MNEASTDPAPPPSDQAPPATDQATPPTEGLQVVDTSAARPADADLRPGIEALLFLADEPLEPAAIAEVVDRDVTEVEQVLVTLQQDYTAAGGGIEVRQAAGGWRMYTAPAARPVLERWALAGRTGRLTQAALETLAVVAYKQPISRSDIGDIRGVSADGAVRSLVARGFVTEVGRDDGPGQAVLYGTTTQFLERLGLQSLDELPPLTDFLPEAPAPDEPEVGTFRDVRRRLAGGDDLPVRGVFEGRRTNTGGEDAGSGADEDDDAMPAPTAPVGARDTEEIDALTDRLDQAARNAVDRLRQAVAAGEQPDQPDEPEPTAMPPRDSETDEPRRAQEQEPEDG